MKKVRVEVIGAYPPCSRCRALEKKVEAVAPKLRSESIDIEVEKSTITEKEILKKYGILVSPALAINNIVKTMGRVPEEREVEKLVREAFQK